MPGRAGERECRDAQVSGNAGTRRERECRDARGAGMPGRAGEQECRNAQVSENAGRGQRTLIVLTGRVVAALLPVAAGSAALLAVLAGRGLAVGAGGRRVAGRRGLRGLLRWGLLLGLLLVAPLLPIGAGLAVPRLRGLVAGLLLGVGPGLGVAALVIAGGLAAGAVARRPDGGAV